MHQFPNLTVVEHPLIRHKLGVLRSRDTSKKTFRALVDEISMLMGYEATKDLPMEPIEVDTPLEPTTAEMVSGKKLALVPVLRAGLGMVEGMLRLMPSVRVGHIGLYRDHDTLQPVAYYFKIPGDVEARQFFVLDPMLATGGSASAAITSLKRNGALKVRLICIVAAPEGVHRMLQDHPDVQVYTAALDRELDEHGYILPGLGDAGDRLFGTR
jgi:uracil phosphoribosyltransferase